MTFLHHFAPDYFADLCRHAVSIRPSVRLSVTVVDISSFFHHWVAIPFYIFRTKRHGNIPTGTPPRNDGVECR